MVKDLESYARCAANLMALGMSRRAVIEEAIAAGHEPAEVAARAMVLWGEMKAKAAPAAPKRGAKAS
jgi:hypothetical protein